MSADWSGKDYDEFSPEASSKRDSFLPTSPGSPPQLGSSPPYQRGLEGVTSTDDARRPNVDYAVREVDFYYGVRGPALSSQPTRKLKTGPADPVGPASAASGWFKGMFGRKSKDAGKGFEVVRSTRAPPQNDEEGNPQSYPEPEYHDSPPMQNESYLPGQQTRSIPDGSRDDEEDDVLSKHATSTSHEVPSPTEETGDVTQLHRYPSAVSAVSDISERYAGESAPTLGPVDMGGDIELPSRFNSRRSGIPSRQPSAAGPAYGRVTPAIPRRSSRRQSSADMGTPNRLPTVMDTIESRTSLENTSYPRLPFATPAGHHRNRFSTGAESFNDEPMSTTAYHRSSPSNATSLMPPSMHERPTSVGFVNQYRASDSIQPGLFSEGTYPGSSAELVDNEAGSPSHRNHSFEYERSQ